VSASPRQFQEFVQRSKGEFAFAKSGYVLGDCGWLSDRSLCYLASGRPVIAQETGFSRFFPPGEGLLAFTDEDSAVAAIERMNSDYDAHRRAARAVAERLLRFGQGAGELLAKVMS
jgi:glycosyltransferase involved in cell wall biosynthesis